MEEEKVVDVLSTAQILTLLISVDRKLLDGSQGQGVAVIEQAVIPLLLYPGKNLCYRLRVVSLLNFNQNDGMTGMQKFEGAKKNSFFVAFHIDLYELDVVHLQMFAEFVERQYGHFFQYRFRFAIIDKALQSAPRPERRSFDDWSFKGQLTRDIR